MLAVKYRQVDSLGTMSGGPMYYIEKGLKMKWLAAVFAFFAAFAAFGIGNMVQANSVAEAMRSSFGIEHWQSSIFLVVITGLVVMGGIKSIARATSAIVPSMIVFYFLAALIILIIHCDKIGSAFELIFFHAFNPTAASGGFLGAVVFFFPFELKLNY